jgi:hypothetical protein
MKKIFILLLMSIPTILSAQHLLTSELNLPRTGDELIKQQVEYKNPGRTGDNVLWDFSQLNPINNAYSLIYSEPGLFNDSLFIMGRDTLSASNLKETDRLIIGTEHNTMYYYRLSGDTLHCLGHENPATLLQHTAPLLSNIFPVNYQDKHSESYASQGIYSMTVPFETTGEITTEADAFGMMVLPSGDTLKHVMRTKTTQTIVETIAMQPDTIINRSKVETCKWYERGYRYPVFETVKTQVFNDTATTERFRTAFFYPPQEQFELGEDAENDAELAVIASEETENNANSENPEDPWEGLTYNIYPNPVRTLLEVEIYLPRPAHIRYQVRTTTGLLYKDENKGFYPEGICRFQSNVSTLPIGNYILDIWLDEKLISEIIMKR